MTRRRVLVARPEPGASQTAARLEGLGYEPAVLPLSEIRTLATDQPDLRDARAVALTSANAARHASREMIAALKSLPWLTVGAATATAGRTVGASVIESVDSDASGLATELIRRFRPGDRLIYLCGRVRLPELENRLDAAGLKVTAVETYDTVDVEPGDKAITDALGDRPVDIALVYSARMAAAFAILRSRASAPLFAATRWIAISQRAAAPLILAGLVVEIAAEPNEYAMFAALESAGRSSLGERGSNARDSLLWPKR